MDVYFLYKSTNKTKKFMVKYINNNTNKINTIQFGASGYTDYTINKNDYIKNLYINRHKHDKINNPLFAGFWSKNLLWNLKTLKESIIDTERKYNITIINKIDN